MALPTMRAGITGREFVRVAGGFGAPALGTSPAGGLDIDNAGNLATDGDITAQSITVENDVQQWSVQSRADDSDKFIIRDATNGQDVIEILPNAGDERMQMTAAETVFNQAGLNVDHRVEGDADQNLLFVDAGNDRVGVKNNAPETFLTVGEASAATTIMSSSSNNEGISVLHNLLRGRVLIQGTAQGELILVDSGGTVNKRASGLRSADDRTTLAVYNDGGGLDKDNTFVMDHATGHIGMGAAPANDVALDVVSTTAAFRPPSMTTAQRDALTASAGMMIYNTTTNTMQFYNGSAWATI